MFFYIFIFLILSCLALISQGRSLKDQKILGLISAVIIICFQGFRWRTGTDWDPYLDCFRYADKYQVEYVEWGYYMFNRIIRIFTNSYTVFLLIQCGIIAYCTIKSSLYFNVTNISLVLLAGFASTPFPIRYTMAVALFFMAYKYIVERKFLKFMVVYILSVMNHQIVALTLPFFFFCHRSYSNKVYYVTYAVCCIIGLLSELVFSQMLQGALLIFNFIPEYSQNKLNAYMVEPQEGRSLLSNVISFLNGCFFILLFTKVKDKYFNGNSKYLVLLNMYVFGLSLGRVVVGAVPYLARVIACFSFGYPLMIIMLISALTLNRKRRVFQNFLLLIYIIYMIVIYCNKIILFKDVFVPYYSVFSDTTRTVIY